MRSLLVLFERPYISRFVRFMKLSLMGTTIVVASGDLGSAPSSACGDGNFYLATAQYPAK
jgi:subtilase family serine protease